MTDAFNLYVVECDWDAVRGGGARSVGEGSMGAVSRGAVALEAARI